MRGRADTISLRVPLEGTFAPVATAAVVAVAQRVGVDPERTEVLERRLAHDLAACREAGASHALVVLFASDVGLTIEVQPAPAQPAARRP